MNGTTLRNKSSYIFPTDNLTDHNNRSYNGLPLEVDHNVQNHHLHEWMVLGFLTIFIFGSCVNVLEVVALLRFKKNGVLTILLQILIADIISFPLCFLDLSTSFHWPWQFSNPICMLYNGTDIVSNCLTVYLLTCLNFHVTSLWNLHNSNDNKNPLTSFQDSSSSECLVSRSERVDYKRRKNDVPVAFPTVLLWILCSSVSMPMYVLSTSINVNGRHLCVVVQNSNGKLLYGLLMFFSIVLPSVLLIMSVVILVVRYSRTAQKNIDNVLVKQLNEIKKLLLFSICLSVFYMITSFQKLLTIASVIVNEFIINENNYFDSSLNVYQTMWHYGGVSCRGVIFYFLFGVHQAVSQKLLCCNTNH